MKKRLEATTISSFLHWAIFKRNEQLNEEVLLKNNKFKNVKKETSIEAQSHTLNH